MADLTIQTVVETGITPAYAAASSGGDAVRNDEGDVVLHVKNGSAGSVTVTVTAQNASTQKPGFGGVAKANAAVAIAAGAEALIGPFPRLAFNDSAGKAQITYSGVTSVTIGALRVPRAA